MIKSYSCVKFSSSLRRIGTSSENLKRNIQDEEVRFCFQCQYHTTLLSLKRGSVKIKSVHMKLPGGRYTFLLFIAIVQILYAVMDTSVHCKKWDGLVCPAGTEPDESQPKCIPKQNPVTSMPGNRVAVIEGPCPRDLQADEHGHCRQHLE